MKPFIIYHNPRCSKSRQALALLQALSLPYECIEYLEHPLSLSELQELAAHFELKDFVRQQEAAFKENHLSFNAPQEILSAMTKHPILMQRPIVCYGKQAIIARDIELFKQWIDKNHQHQQ